MCHFKRLLSPDINIVKCKITTYWLLCFEFAQTWTHMNIVVAK